MDAKNLLDLYEKVFNSIKNYYFKLRPEVAFENFSDELETCHYKQLNFEQQHLFYDENNLINFYEKNYELIEQLINGMILYKLFINKGVEQIMFYILCFNKLKCEKLEIEQSNKYKKILACFAIIIASFYFFEILKNKQQY